MDSLLDLLRTMVYAVEGPAFVASDVGWRKDIEGSRTIAICRQLLKVSCDAYCFWYEMSN